MCECRGAPNLVQYSMVCLLLNLFLHVTILASTIFFSCVRRRKSINRRYLIIVDDVSELFSAILNFDEINLNINNTNSLIIKES